MSAYTRRSRQVIDAIIAGNDPFNVMKMTAAAFPVCIISEAWSPEKRAEVIANASAQGYTMIDHLVVGDYDLVLWFSPKVGDKTMAYVVSINNAEHDPLDILAQQVKQPGQQPPLKAIKDKLSSWVDDHGSVIVGSVLTDRNLRYLRLCRRLFPGYSFKPFYGDDFKYGFTLSKG